VGAGHRQPSEYTTLTGLAIAAVLSEALPPGVLTAVTGAGDVGYALVRDPRVGKVMFTGSVKTGMKVIEASAGNMPRLTLELGGNDAAIVLPDVDPQAIAEGPGVGLDEGNVLGPLQNQMQWNVVNRLVEDAKVRGAQVVMGGDPDTAAPGYFYPKTLIADIDNAAPPTASTSASARRCGPPTATRLSPSPRGCKPGRCGSTATAASIRASRSAAPSAPDTAWSSASRD